MSVRLPLAPAAATRAGRDHAQRAGVRAGRANPGRHGEVPGFEVDSSERFFLRHLSM